MEEQEQKRSAEYILVFASPYKTSERDYCPHMHLEFKQNVENMTQGKVYVEIADDGVLGVGHELMASVSRGQISGALVSVSNLAPAAPELDILNIPFWASEQQAYLNLVTSKAWNDLIISKIKTAGKLDPLFHYLPGARTVTSTKRSGKRIRVPDDIVNTVFRVPRSPVLKVFYQLIGAPAVDVAWKDVALMAKMGRIAAMDPSVVGLFNGPNGLRHHIGVISQLQSVYDGWLAVISQHWLANLPINLRLSLREAAEKTFIDHLAVVGQIDANCKKAFERLGTSIYVPTPAEREEWQTRGGYTHKRWDSIKSNVLGNRRSFMQLLEATKINNGYRVV